MEDIAKLAATTRELTQKNLKRSQQIATLSSELLTTIKFFQLSPNIYMEVDIEPSDLWDSQNNSLTTTNSSSN